MGRKKRPAADCEVRGGSATHDLDSRSIKKLNAEEEEEEDEEEEETFSKFQQKEYRHMKCL